VEEKQTTFTDMEIEQKYTEELNNAVLPTFFMRLQKLKILPKWI